MKRSFFEYKDNQLLLMDTKLLEVDCVIISASSLLKAMENSNFNEEIFNELISNKSIYIKVSFQNYISTKKILNNDNFPFISGFYLENVESKFLNKMTDFSRCYEKEHKLNFGSLIFIGEISTPKATMEIKKICNYDRLSFLTFNVFKFKDYIGVNTIDKMHYFNKILECAFYYKKFILLHGVNSINEYKNLGIIGAITDNVLEVITINDIFTPNEKEIKEADLYLNMYLEHQKTHSKKQYYDFSTNKLLYYNLILERAYILNKNYKVNSLSLINNNVSLLKTKKQEISKFYTFGEELGNSITHGIGIIAGVVFLILLLIKVNNNYNIVNFMAYLIYSLSVIVLYTSSFIYHLLPLGTRAKMIFQRFDHMTIYLLIAGSYTPFALIALGGLSGIILASIIWFGAISGLLLNLFWFGKFRGFHIFLYLLLGWAALFFIVPIIRGLGTTGTIFLFAGGVSYTIGIIFYSFKLFKFTHMVWHLFVLLGTILHFLGIYLCL